MTPAVVVDIGNSRTKWGLCGPDRVLDAASLDGDDEAAWDAQAAAWGLPGPAAWAVASVHPRRRERFVAWAERRGGRVTLFVRGGQLPLETRLPEPDKAGVDRLLAAVAANRLRDPARPAVVVMCGTAVVADLLDASGVYLGGAIFPGPRLMARSLHEHTALLPLLGDIPPDPPGPAVTTPAAMELGVHAAIVGGVNHLVAAYAAGLGAGPDVFLTGGAVELLRGRVPGRVVPHLVLEGLRVTTAGA